MSLFNPTPLTQDRAEAVARQLLVMGNETFDRIVKRYNSQYDVLWDRPDSWTTEQIVADAQAILDAMDTQVGPGTAAAVFQASGGLGVYINTVQPDTIPTERLSPPVPYSVDPTTFAITLELPPAPPEPEPVL